MPKFTLSVHLRQTLVDSEVVEIEAATIEDAKTAAELLAGIGGEDADQDLADGVAIDDATEARLRGMDPHEVVASECEIDEGDYTTAHLRPTPDPLGIGDQVLVGEGQDRVPGGGANDA